MQAYIVFSQASYDEEFQIVKIFLIKEKADAELEYLMHNKLPFMHYWIEDQEITE